MKPQSPTTRGRRRSALCGVALGAGLLVGATAGAASAQQYPSFDGDLTVTDQSNDQVLATGEYVEISGGGFRPGSQVTVAIGDPRVVLGVTVADAQGNISASFTLPSTVPAGDQNLTASGESGITSGGVLVLGKTVTVAAQTTTTTTTATQGTTATTAANTTTTAQVSGSGATNAQLAYTGGSSGALALVGAGLVAAGGGLIVTRRRNAGA